MIRENRAAHMVKQNDGKAGKAELCERIEANICLLYMAPRGVMEQNRVDGRVKLCVGGDWRGRLCDMGIAVI